jgi:hypothetical protein
LIESLRTAPVRSPTWLYPNAPRGRATVPNLSLAFAP